MQDVIQRLRKFRDDRNWAQFHTPKDLAISTSIEAGELPEIFQWKRAEAPVDQPTKEQVRSEAADVLLYLLLLCNAAGVDLLAGSSSQD